jgi:hypothetical protein
MVAERPMDELFDPPIRRDRNLAVREAPDAR